MKWKEVVFSGFLAYLLWCVTSAFFNLVSASPNPPGGSFKTPAIVNHVLIAPLHCAGTYGLCEGELCDKVDLICNPIEDESKGGNK